MKKAITYILLFVSCYLLPLQAQTTMTLKECQDIARSRNLTVQNGALGIERAKQMQKTAFELEPTAITFSQDLSDGASTDNSIGLSQEFSLPGVYSAKRKSLKAQTLVESRKQNVTIRELEQDVESAYYNIMYVREKYRILLQQDSAYTKFHIVAAAKEKAGEAGRLVHINADKLTDESRLSLQNTLYELRQAQYKLAQLMNCDILVEPVEKDLVQIDAVNIDTMNNVYNRLSDAEIQASQRALTETKREALPTVTLEAKYYTLIKGMNPYHIDRSAFEGGNGFVYLGVGVNVPLSFGAHSAKVKAAQHDIDIQNNNKLIQQQEIKALLEEQQSECIKAQQSIKYYKEKGLRHADELIRIAHVSYEQGEIDYIELMDNFSAASDIRLKYIDAVNNYNQAMIKIKSLENK